MGYFLIQVAILLYYTIIVNSQVTVQSALLPASQNVTTQYYIKKHVKE